MTRTVFTGGRVFDGTGADPADADIAIQDGRILEVGPGLGVLPSGPRPSIFYLP